MSPTQQARAPVRKGRRNSPAAPPDPSPTDVALARLAKALGHPTRVTIVRMLSAQGVCNCGDIVCQHPLAQATVSQHLKVLKDAGLVQGEIDGPRVCYCIHPETVKKLKALVGAL